MCLACVQVECWNCTSRSCATVCVGVVGVGNKAHALTMHVLSKLESVPKKIHPVDVE